PMENHGIASGFWRGIIGQGLGCLVAAGIGREWGRD
nr:hypothetical protein [Tanacetum cinerariifolium]